MVLGARKITYEITSARHETENRGVSACLATTSKGRALEDVEGVIASMEKGAEKSREGKAKRKSGIAHFTPLPFNCCCLHAGKFKKELRE